MAERIGGLSTEMVNKPGDKVATALHAGRVCRHRARVLHFLAPGSGTGGGGREEEGEREEKKEERAMPSLFFLSTLWNNWMRRFEGRPVSW